MSAADQTAGRRDDQNASLEIAIMKELVAHIQELSQEGLIRELLFFRGRLRLDFTEAFLTSLPPDQLRHLLLAACLQSAEPVTRRSVC